jgi:diguanylate cyclase (GGDEF)-like protein/PAS domain S-box-containing protein
MTQHEERDRQAGLERMEIFDSMPEPEFDELVELAAAICEAPISIVSLLDTKRVWIKAKLGVADANVPREVSFCAHNAHIDELMIVEDAAADPRFAANPLVTGKEQIRFYAGIPLLSPEGLPLGALCVLDRRPRKLSEAQGNALRVLGRQVSARLELRMQRLQVKKALQSAEEVKEKLASSERRFQTFMDSAPFISFLKDADGKIIFYNRKCAETFGISREDWLGKTDFEIASHEDAVRFRAHDRAAIDSGTLNISYEKRFSPDGGESSWCSYKFPCIGDDGQMMLGGFWVNITEQQKHERELQRSQEDLEAANIQLIELAATDALTGLANRRVLDGRLSVEFAQARRKKRALSVMILDLDAFKRRNDLYGHHQGDLALQKFAMLVSSCVRHADLAARYGGEEFAILLPETDEEQAMQLADRILQATRYAEWEKEPLTVSIGVSCMDATTPNIQRLMSLADEALYAAKKGGRDRAVSYKSFYKQMVDRISESRQ